MGRSRPNGRAPLPHVVILTAAPKHTYYYYILVHAHTCVFFIYIYICIHTILYYYLRAYIYIHMNALPHTRAHTHTHYIAICVLVYIYTQLHIYYIIVLYVSEKERPVDYGRSAFLVSESMYIDGASPPAPDPARLRHTLSLRSRLAPHHHR